MGSVHDVSTYLLMSHVRLKVTISVDKIITGAATNMNPGQCITSGQNHMSITHSSQGHTRCHCLQQVRTLSIAVIHDVLYPPIDPPSICSNTLGDITFCIPLMPFTLTGGTIPGKNFLLGMR